MNLIPDDWESCLPSQTNLEAFRRLVKSDKMVKVWEKLFSDFNSYKETIPEYFDDLRALTIHSFFQVIIHSASFGEPINTMTKTERTSKIDQLQACISKITSLISELGLNFNTLNSLPPEVLSAFARNENRLNRKIIKPHHTPEQQHTLATKIQEIHSIEKHSLISQLHFLKEKSNELYKFEQLVPSPNTKDAELTYFYRSLTRFYLEKFEQPLYDHTAIIASEFFDTEILKDDIRNKTRELVNSWNQRHKLIDS